MSLHSYESPALVLRSQLEAALFHLYGRGDRIDVVDTESAVL